MFIYLQLSNIHVVYGFMFIYLQLSTIIRTYTYLCMFIYLQYLVQFGEDMGNSALGALLGGTPK